MIEKVIGDIRFFCDGHSLKFGSSSDPSLPQDLTLDVEGVKQLSSLVGMLLGSCFNTRHTFRVELWDGAGVSTTLIHGSTCIEVKPINVSLTGVLVEHTPRDILDLTPGDSLDVVLKFEEQEIRQTAVVRRVEPRGYGLFFKDSVRNEQIDPKPEVTDLIMELQRRWLLERSQYHD